MNICQTCGGDGGQVLSYTPSPGISASRFVCPHCVNRLEAVVQVAAGMLKGEYLDEKELVYNIRIAHQRFLETAPVNAAVTWPSLEQIKTAKEAIAEEDREAARRLNDPKRLQQIAENDRRAALPSEHPDHICGMACDGQDGSTSYCSRLRVKLGFRRS